jgi:hypothetical protein
VREALGPWQGLRRARGIAAAIGARGYIARGRATLVGANAARRQCAGAQGSLANLRHMVMVADRCLGPSRSCVSAC